MDEVLRHTGHRPYPLPSGAWRLRQRWNDLLFAHWPVDVTEIMPHLPPGIEVDVFAGSAWVGVVPFWMDQVRTRVVGQTSISIPGAARFPELNLRTYVRSGVTGLPGVFFFSLDASSLLAILAARLKFHLPYFWANMRLGLGSAASIRYSSRRLMSANSVRFNAQYRSRGPVAPPSAPGTLAYFLTERYCLFTTHRDRILVGHIHHLPWPLEPAEAVINLNEIPAACGIRIPEISPVLHFAKALRVYLWPLVVDR